MDMEANYGVIQGCYPGYPVIRQFWAETRMLVTASTLSHRHPGFYAAVTQTDGNPGCSALAYDELAS